MNPRKTGVPRLPAHFGLLQEVRRVGSARVGARDPAFHIVYPSDVSDVVTCDITNLKVSHTSVSRGRGTLLPLLYIPFIFIENNVTTSLAPVCRGFGGDVKVTFLFIPDNVIGLHLRSRAVRVSACGVIGSQGRRYVSEC